MPAPKGSKNARAYQEAIIKTNKALIEGELAKLRDSRAKFESLTALSQAVAKRTGITDVTIRRNKQYRSLVTKYIHDQGGKSGYVSRAEAELNELRHKVTQLELRLSNISADNDRLRAFISKRNEAEVAVPQISSSASNSYEEANWEQDRLRTYHLVHAVLSHAYYEVNFEQNTIEDRTGIEENEVVAGRNLAQPYIEWLKKKGELSFG